MINPLQAPINYMGMIPKPDIAGGLEGLAQAFQERNKRKTAEAAQAQFQADLQGAQQSGTQGAWLSMIAKYPQFREAFSEVRKGVGEENLNNEFSQGSGISIALENGKPEVAKQLVSTILEAKKNSGQPAGVYQQIFDAIESGNVETARSGTNMALAILDPDRYKKMVESFNAQKVEERAANREPSELTKLQADAQKAAVDAKFAESNAVIDLQKKNWDITKIQEDIKVAKLNSQIAAANAATAREGNSIKRQENQLKLDELKMKRDTAVNEKAAEVESARGTMDNMLNTADRILKAAVASRDKNGKPTDFTATMRAATGPVDSRLPTMQPDVADFEELVTTLGSQAFLAQIPNIKGMGALSNAEGEKLQAALQNFSLRQSPQQLVQNLEEAQRLILKGRANLSKRYGVPDSVPDTPAAQPGTGTGKTTDQMLKELGVVR